MLAPASNSLCRRAVEEINKINPDVLTEGLYLIPYPENVSTIDVDFYNYTRALSSLSEVIYYSSRRKDFVHLFEEAYVISQMNKKKPLPDPVAESIPEHSKLYLYVKEVNFGKSFYSVDYYWDGTDLGFFMKNTAPIRAFIKAVDKQNLLNVLIIMPTEKGYLVYGATSVKLSNKDFIYKMTDPPTAFYRRLYAIETWMYNNITGSDKKPDFGKPLNF
jgi:hypothetical protein